MLSVATKYAIRSLWRHPRRTLLSIVGVAVGCASSLVTISFVRGEGEMFMRGVAETGTGHVRVAPKDWGRIRDINMRLDRWAEELEAVRSRPGVRVATPRARIGGLLGAGVRTVAVEVAGIDPATERDTNRLLRSKLHGRYLQSDDAGAEEIPVVVGKAAAERLEVGLDDLLMITTADIGGKMRQAMLTIVGTVSTGNDSIDETICQVHLADFERLSGSRDASEILILLKEPKKLDNFAQELRGGLIGNNDVMTWSEVSPQMKDAVAIDESFSWLTVMIVVFLVFLGIMSAQLTAVLERRREFAVLSAVGMKGHLLVRVMFLEGVTVGVVGGTLGLILAAVPVYFMSTAGINLGAMMGEKDLVMSGVLIDPILYGDMGLWLVPYCFGISMIATVLATIYPALYALKTNPADALRVS